MTPIVTLLCRRDWAVRLDPGLGTGSCQGHLVMPCPSKAASQASLALGWKPWPAVAVAWPCRGSVCPPVQQICDFACVFYFEFFGSSTIDTAQRGGRVFFVLDRIIFCFVFFSRKPSFLSKKTNTLNTHIVCFNFLFFFAFLRTGTEQAQLCQ